MTVSSVAEILTAKTADQLTTEQLAVMAAADPPLPVTAYQPGSVALTLIDAECDALADVHATVAQLGASAFMGEATGDWLTLRAKSTFDLDRILATYTRGTVTLACTALAGPETITPGALVITTPSGLLYRSTNAANVIVPNNGSVTIPVRAEAAGTDYNVSLAGATIVTPAAAGMSVSAASLLTWITATARNEETDAELVRRCRGRWSTLGSGFGPDAVAYWATSAPLVEGGEAGSAGCTRVAVPATTGDGTYRVICAGASGALGSPQIAAVQATIDLHKPITDLPTVESAVGTTVTVLGNLQWKPGRGGSDNEAIVRAAITAYVNALDLPDGYSSVTVDRDALISAAYTAVPGAVADLDITAPAADVTVTLGYVAIADVSGLTFS